MREFADPCLYDRICVMLCVELPHFCCESRQIAGRYPVRRRLAVGDSVAASHGAVQNFGFVISSWDVKFNWDPAE